MAHGPPAFHPYPSSLFLPFSARGDDPGRGPSSVALFSPGISTILLCAFHEAEKDHSGRDAG
jgi:hypothetical protein